MYYDDQIARVMGTPIKPNNEVPDPDDRMIKNMPIDDPTWAPENLVELEQALKQLFQEYEIEDVPNLYSNLKITLNRTLATKIGETMEERLVRCAIRNILVEALSPSEKLALKDMLDDGFISPEDYYKETGEMPDDYEVEFESDEAAAAPAGPSRIEQVKDYLEQTTGKGSLGNASAFVRKIQQKVANAGLFMPDIMDALKDYAASQFLTMVLDSEDPKIAGDERFKRFNSALKTPEFKFFFAKNFRDPAFKDAEKIMVSVTDRVFDRMGVDRESKEGRKLAGEVTKMITRYNMPQGEKVNDLIKALNDVSGSKKIKMGGRTLLATIEKEVGEAIGRAGDMKDANNRIPLNVAERWLNLPNAQKMKKFTAAFEEKF
jgi:hypothetical protein